MMKTILFQGDSITDCSREKTNPTELGRGYALLAASELGAEFPGEYLFYNRGISGNRVVDLYARIKADVINLKPDYLSILIGVNDVLHEQAYQNGVDADKFLLIYDMLIVEIRAALPDVKIVLLAPYVLHRPPIAEHWAFFRTEVDKRIEAVQQLAKKHDLPMIPLQEIFDAATAKNGDAAYWSADGVHPTPYGHRLIADAWLKQFKAL